MPAGRLPPAHDRRWVPHSGHNTPPSEPSRPTVPAEPFLIVARAPPCADVVTDGHRQEETVKAGTARHLIGRPSLMITESVSSPCRAGAKVHGNHTLSAIMSVGASLVRQWVVRGRHSVLVAKRMMPTHPPGRPTGCRRIDKRL